MDKALRQHLEMADFFTGFLVRGTEPSAQPEPPQAHPAEAPRQGREEDPSDLNALSRAIAGCRKCELCQTRAHTVPGEGAARAGIMLVGEAPGADEDAQGRPFVGRAGQLLDKILQACGLDRDQVYIANILKCRPPGNRDPHADEIVRCLPYLTRQIDLIQPDIIIALGAHAARTLLNTNESIGRLRGRIHMYPNGPDRPPIKLMATYHPAYLLRYYTQENRRHVWEDMKKAMAEIGRPVRS